MINQTLVFGLIFLVGSIFGLLFTIYLALNQSRENTNHRKDAEVGK